MGVGAIVTPPRSPARSEPGPGLSAVFGALLAGSMLALALAWSRVVPHLPLPPWMLVSGLVGLALLVLLTFARFEAAVLLGLLLLGVVKFEPAPPDALFAVVIGVVVISGREELQRMPRLLAAIIGCMVLANLLAMTQARDPTAGLRFFAITLYLSVFCVWFASYIDRRRRARAVVIGYGIAAASSAALGTLALLTPLPHRDFFLLQGCCRAEGLFQDANVFGPFLIPPLLILLHEALVPQLIPRRFRPLVIATVVLLELGVLLSFSRAAWLNLALGLMIMLAVLAMRPGGFAKAFKLDARPHRGQRDRRRRGRDVRRVQLLPRACIAAELRRRALRHAARGPGARGTHAAGDRAGAVRPRDAVLGAQRLRPHRRGAGSARHHRVGLLRRRDAVDRGAQRRRGTKYLRHRVRGAPRSVVRTDPQQHGRGLTSLEACMAARSAYLGRRPQQARAARRTETGACVTSVDYATWHSGVSGADLADFVRTWAAEHPGARVCDVGAGANPILDSDFVERCELEYALLDIDQGELDKAPPGFQRVQADLSDPAFVAPATYDLVVSQTVAEHVADGAAFHRNVASLLRPGGLAAHFFPTYWTLPFMVNRLVPEEITEPILVRIQPHRTRDGSEGKFPARYRWCRGPTRRQLARLRAAGFDVERYRGYFGHDYYTPIAPLQGLEAAKSRFLVRHPVPQLTSYAMVVVRRR